MNGDKENQKGEIINTRRVEDETTGEVFYEPIMSERPTRRYDRRGKPVHDPAEPGGFIDKKG